MNNVRMALIRVLYTGQAQRKIGHQREAGKSHGRPSRGNSPAIGCLSGLLPFRDRLAVGHLQDHCVPLRSWHLQIQKGSLFKTDPRWVISSSLCTHLVYVHCGNKT